MSKIKSAIKHWKIKNQIRVIERKIEALESQIK
jgi:hypothetical protein